MAVLLAVVAVVSVIIILIHFAEIYHAQWYIPLQLKSSALDRWLALAALIHLWSTLVSYDTEPEFHSVRIKHCSLWSYWLQIFLGLQPWVLIMVFRVLQHGRDFHPALKNWSHRRHFLAKLVITLVSVIPLFFVCFFVPITLDDEEKCHAPVEWKVPIMVWSAVYLILLSALGVEVYRKSLVVTRSGRALRDCVVIAVFVLLAISAVHIIGFEEDGFAVVPLVAFLHLFVTLRCFAYTIWKAVTHDFEYANSFFTKVGESKNIDHRSMVTVDLDRNVMGDFINFANLKGRNDLVQLYEDIRDIVITKRECRDAGDMWTSMVQNNRIIIGAVLGTQADLVDSFSPEYLYMRTLCHMQQELGKEYLATETQHSEGSIFDTGNETLSSSETDGEIIYTEALENFELRVGFGSTSESSSDTTDGSEEEEIVYADIKGFKEKQG